MLQIFNIVVKVFVTKVTYNDDFGQKTTKDLQIEYLQSVFSYLFFHFTLLNR